jgi:hypothetical protein
MTLLSTIAPVSLAWLAPVLAAYRLVARPEQVKENDHVAYGSERLISR